MAVQRKDCRLVVSDAQSMAVVQIIQFADPTGDGVCVSMGAWDPDSGIFVMTSARDLAAGPYTRGALGFSLTASCQLQLQWNTFIGINNDQYAGPFTSPVIAGPIGKRVAFFGTGISNTVHAVAVKNGRLLWNATLDGLSLASGSGTASVFASPTVINGTLLIGGWDYYGDSGHKLYAFRI